MANDKSSNIFPPESPASRQRISKMYDSWFLEYASYVILDRAVPYAEDGLKPVQRRILHALKELDDGRFNKVANIIGHTMQYHPHGDASIGDAMVNMGQKNLLIETQGNWGNVETGDSAAAPRYIEARLSKFALEVVFNPKVTEWTPSYDGRKKEPVTLPVKFPLVLAQGVEGIAVGLSTRILPHNFIELCQAAINYLKKKPFELQPDFITGGMADVSQYNAGERGGRVRVRASIQEVDKKTLRISNVPYGVTTSTLIDSILKANDKGKIKIKRIEDNTAKHVDILVHLASGTSPDLTIDALYAFTNCEVSISPQCTIIVDGKPELTNVHEVLKRSVNHTKFLLQRELQIRLEELQEGWHRSSLEKIFIEERIYRDIEEAESWEEVISRIEAGLKPFIKRFRREITQEDIVALTEIKIKRISKYDAKKADEYIQGLELEMAEVKNHLEHLNDFTIRYFEGLLKKYGEGRERKTELRTFDTIEASVVAVANAKLYVNREEGFVGTGLKKDEFVAECSDLDDVIVFREDGVMQVAKVSDKGFFGKGIIYVGVFRKGDDRTVYHMIYRDGKQGNTYVKRFQVQSIIREKEYDLTQGTEGSKVLYFSAQPNGEQEVIQVKLKPKSRLRVTEFEYDFAELDIKGRSAKGNILTRHSVKKISQQSVGASTLGGRELWFDPALMRLNADGHGQLLGEFEGDEQILAIYEDGTYELSTYDLTNRYDGKGRVVHICKFDPEAELTAIYYSGEHKASYLKRFKAEATSQGRKHAFINDHKASKLLWASHMQEPVVAVTYSRAGKGEAKQEELDLWVLAELRGWKAVGNQLTERSIKEISLVSGDDPQPKALPKPSPEGNAPAVETDEPDEPTLF